MPRDLSYVALLFVMFVIPRFLQRYRLPSAITSLGLGMAATALELFQHDETIALLATFGIVALFLFAGLDVDFDELRPNAKVLGQHLVIWSVTLGLLATAALRVYHLGWRPAALLALALVTPSTGFILDSLALFGLTEAEEKWTKSKAIASELLALLVMFVTLQSTSLEQMAIGTFALAALILLLPPLFRFFAVRIAPYAPRSEFAFLLMVAVVCAAATRRLGVYYLVGAFVVGIAARQFRERLPAMSSERMLGAVEAFASFFVPFYFFHAGQEMSHEDLDLRAIGVGLLFVAVGGLIRIGEVTLHRWVVLREAPKRSLRVSLSLFPTLVFALVVAGILKDRFAIPGYLFGGLVLYTIISTLVPGLVLHVPPVTYDAPTLEHLPATAEYPATMRGRAATVPGRAAVGPAGRPAVTPPPGAPTPDVPTPDAPTPAPGSDY